MFSCAQLTLGYLNAQALLEERFHAVSANHFLRSTISYGNGLSRTLDRSQDNLLRPSGFQLMNGTTEEHATSYGYDTVGRLAGVHTAAAYSATPDFGYNYLTNSGSLVESVTSPAHTVSNSYETTRNVLDVKSNATNGANPSVVSAFDYSVNNLGQRDDVSRTGSAFTSANTETWNYNAKGEVETADHSTNNAFDRSYEFDGIGNRKKSAEGLDLTAPTAMSYNTNALNQYSQITNAQISNRLHDADGNLIDDGTKLFVWDAENRLIEIKLKSDDSAVATYAYDYQSRRITKTVGSTVTNFVYDGWNPIAEYTSALSPLSFTLSTSYTWGMDLSGSMQGAGGVGGLLSLNDGSATYYLTYDGNGNVSEYVDATGVVVAHYEYDAFGQVVASGTKADEFTHQFSTKQLDSESGLHYYGYRYYDSSTGSWPSRDPIEERGGVNIYSFVKNGSASSIDILGMVTWSPKIQLGNLSIGDMNVSVGIDYGGGLSWALANGYLVFSNDGVSGQATGSYYSWGSWGKTGTIEAEISVTCDDEGNISFSPMTDSDIASVQIAAAIDLEAKVSTTDPKSGTIKADIAVSYKEPLSLSASAFGITVHNVGDGVTDKSGKTVTYICECED